MGDETQTWQERSDLFSPLLPMLPTSKPPPSLAWAGETVLIWSLVPSLSQHSSFSTQKPKDLNIFARSHQSSVECFLPFSHWKNENGLWPQSQKGPLWAAPPPPSITPLHSLCSNHTASVCSLNISHSGPGTGYALCLENPFPVSLLSGQILPPQNKVYWPLPPKYPPPTPLVFSYSSYFYVFTLLIFAWKYVVHLLTY